MGNTYAIIAFALLWIFLGGFFFVVFRTLLSRGRTTKGRDGEDRWEHGL
jgi:hypothetical protein